MIRVHVSADQLANVGFAQACPSVLCLPKLCCPLREMEEATRIAMHGFWYRLAIVQPCICALLLTCTHTHTSHPHPSFTHSHAHTPHSLTHPSLAHTPLTHLSHSHPSLTPHLLLQSCSASTTAQVGEGVLPRAWAIPPPSHHTRRAAKATMGGDSDLPHSGGYKAKQWCVCVSVRACVCCACVWCACVCVCCVCVCVVCVWCACACLCAP